jgi:hypothetical protein
MPRKKELWKAPRKRELWEAVQRGNVHTVKRLLADGADVSEEQDEVREGALQWEFFVF